MIKELRILQMTLNDLGSNIVTVFKQKNPESELHFLKMF